MKITKSQLKKLIKQEIHIMTEQQSAGDLETQRDLERKADYGPSYAHPSVEQGARQIDLLTDIRGLLQQILNKP